MVDDPLVIQAARREEAQLDAELTQAFPAYRRLKLLRSFIQEYGTTLSAPTVEAIPKAATTRAPRASSNLSSQVISGAEAYFNRVKRRAQSREIAEVLIAEGIPLSGQNPSSVVSSYLSTSNLFDNVRGEGYGLSAWARELSTQPNAQQSGGADQARDEPPEEETAAPDLGAAA